METARDSGLRYAADMSENWLQDALDKSGKTQAQLAREMTEMLGRSFDRAAINKIAKSKRSLKADEAFAIVRLTGAELPPEMTSGAEDALSRSGPLAIPAGRVSYGGTVRAGEWLAVDDFNQDLGDHMVPASVPRHPSYPQLRQSAWLIKGDSMDQAGILEGMWAVAASYGDYVDRIGELDNGNYVIVERSRHGGAERELTVKEVQFARKGMRLVPRSSNPVHKEFFIDLDPAADNDTEQVSVVGVVLWVGRDMDPRSRR